MCGVPSGWTICEIVLLGQSRLLERLDKLSRWPCSKAANSIDIIMLLALTPHVGPIQRVLCQVGGVRDAGLLYPN
jgi:hypothetical protein